MVTSREVAQQIITYSWVMVLTSIVLWPVAVTGWFYPGVAITLGIVFLVEAYDLRSRARDSEELCGHQADAVVPPLQRLPRAALRRRGRRSIPVIPADWRPHQRDDGELIGYLVPDENDLVVPVNLVGHPIGDAMDQIAAEQLLEDAGLSYLAEPWLLRRDDGSDQRVVIVEVDADHVVVTDAQFALGGRSSEGHGRRSHPVGPDRPPSTGMTFDPRRPRPRQRGG